MKTVAPCKSLTERRFLAERALVKRYVKITSEPLPRNEVASLCCKQGGTAVIKDNYRPWSHRKWLQGLFYCPLSFYSVSDEKTIS